MTDEDAWAFRINHRLQRSLVLRSGCRSVPDPPPPFQRDMPDQGAGETIGLYRFADEHDVFDRSRCNRRKRFLVSTIRSPWPVETSKIADLSLSRYKTTRRGPRRRGRLKDRAGSALYLLDLFFKRRVRARQSGLSHSDFHGRCSAKSAQSCARSQEAWLRDRREPTAGPTWSGGSMGSTRPAGMHRGRPLQHGQFAFKNEGAGFRIESSRCEDPDQGHRHRTRITAENHDPP